MSHKYSRELEKDFASKPRLLCPSPGINSFPSNYIINYGDQSYNEWIILGKNKLTGEVRQYDTPRSHTYDTLEEYVLNYNPEKYLKDLSLLDKTQEYVAYKVETSLKLTKIEDFNSCLEKLDALQSTKQEQ